MKKICMIITVAGILALIAGGIVFCAGMNMLDWDFLALDTETLTAAEAFTSDEDIDSITLTGSWQYEITRGDSLKVEYFLSNESEITIGTTQKSDGKYAFEFKEVKKKWFNIGVSEVRRFSVEYKVKVQMPQNCEFNVKGSSVEVSVTDINFKNVKIKGSSAEATLNNVTAQDITVDGSDAKLTMNGSSAKDIKIKGSSAKATISASTVLNTLTVGGSDAKLTMNDSSANDISIKGSSAKATIGTSTVSNALTVDGSDAKLTLKDSSAKNINADGSSVKVEADNADILAFTGKGSSLKATFNLKGEASDIQSATVSGSSANLYIDGAKQKEKQYRNTGIKNLSASGSSVSLKINMTGGTSIFTE